MARAIAEVLDEADRYYESGDRGLFALSWRCSMAIRTARLVYSSIGRRIRRTGCDPLAGRAFVSLPGKLTLAVRALGASTADLARRAFRRRVAAAAPARLVSYPEDVLPV